MSAPACYGLCRCRLAFLCFVLLLYFADFCRTAIYFKGLQIYGNYGGISARGGHLGSAGPKVRLTCLSASALHAALLAQVCGGIAPVFVPFRHFRPSQPWCDSARMHVVRGGCFASARCNTVRLGALRRLALPRELFICRTAVAPQLPFCPDPLSS